MKNELRRKKHQRDPELEQLLLDLNSCVISSEKNKLTRNQYPIVFVMGCARSGTTLVTQYLASSGLFSYASNLVSRFYMHPGFGAKLQKMMVDLDYREELTLEDWRRIQYGSSLGKTKGLMQPHEFWYYWRRFFKFKNIQVLSASDLSKVNTKAFVRGLVEIEQVFKKPLMMKGMILNWHIPFLNKLFTNALFVFVQRDPAYNALALLKARSQFFGSEEKWYSFKPPEYSALIDLPPWQQVAGQVHYTNKAIDQGLQVLDKSKFIQVSYESFCNRPECFFEDLKKLFEGMGHTFENSLTQVPKLIDSNKLYTNRDYNKMKDILKLFQ